MTLNYKQSGNIALIVLLVVSIVSLSIGLNVHTNALRSLTIHTTERVAKQTLWLAESCVDEILWQIQEDENYTTTTVTLPLGTCTANFETNGNDRIITISATGSEYITRTIQVSITIDSGTIVWNTWQEF